MTRGQQQHPGLPARYQFVTDLNKGSYGVVSLFRDTQAPADNNLVAIKSIFKSNSQHRNVDEEVRQEIRVHKLLGNAHPHLVKLLNHYETPECTYLVMEYYPNGDLYEAIRGERGPSHIESIRDFMLQLIDAVQYCHSKGIYHRDIKPENILIGSNHMVRLADFGLATTSRICNEFGVGSERYMAPELFDEKFAGEYDAEKSDIWSIGICLLNILFCRNPFTVACEKDKLFMDFASNREALFDIFPTLSSDTFAVLRHALTIDPDNRSLDKMRDELLNVQIWTIDDDFYDDEQLEPVPIPQISVSDEQQLPVDQEPFAGELVAQGDDDTVTSGMTMAAADEFITTTTNRQPLRTPSIAVEAAAFSYSKPWIRTMQFTPPSKPLMMMGSARPKRPSHLSSRLDSISSEDEDEQQDEGARSSSQSGDYDDDVFVMDLNSPMSKMSVRNSSDSSSLNSVPSLVQSIASTSTSATNTAQQQSKLSASLPTWKGPVPPRRQPTITNPGSAAGGPTKNMPIPGTSAPNSNRDFLKFSTSWSDLAFEDDDDDSFSLHSDDFYEFIKSEFPMTLPGALSKGVKAGGWS